MGAYYTWWDRLDCLLIILVAYGGAYLLVALVGGIVQRRQRLKWQRERQRLEKVVSDYNKAFEDDYNPFER